MMTRAEKDEHIKAIASRLAANFIRPLLSSTNQKSYSIRIAGLAEILDWAGECYEQHIEKVGNLAKFGCHNGVKHMLTEEEIIVFGAGKIKKFLALTADVNKYFHEKYASLFIGDDDITAFYS